MALLELKADPAVLSRLAIALERIADALDRAVPPIPIPTAGKPRGPESLRVTSDEQQWKIEQETERQRAQGLPPDAPGQDTEESPGAEE